MTNKPKILLVSPSPKLAGGIARWTGHIMQYAQKNINLVDIELFGGVGEIYLSKKRTFETFHRIFRGVRLYTKLIHDFKKRLKVNKPEVVHICTSSSLALIKDIFLLRASKSAGVKSVIHFHFGRIPQLVRTNNWEWKLLKKVVKLADTTIVIDQSSYDALNEIGISKNLEILANPIADSILDIVHNNEKLTKNEREIVFVGHLIPTKGVFELVDACVQIPDIKVKMYGAGGEDMKRLIVERAGEDNHWLEVVGEIEYSDVIRKMMRAGIFVLPTYTEGFPNVILESMACGCPIVASGVGAIPQMLNQGSEPTCGIVIEPQNVKQLKEAIEKMLTDREFANMCGSNAKKRVEEQYSMKAVYNKMEKIWIDTIKKR